MTLRIKVRSLVLSEERSCLASGIHPYFTDEFKIQSTDTAKVAFYIPSDGKTGCRSVVPPIFPSS